ncbi:hypothetical protein ACH41E_17240 [Streptomyces sp. NPDC020412]|uniref:hypothetical protein n=1 Tax=Streptomyces sp. NPDC020412 TaxID=3365073 RepID=UPI0037A90CD3
MSAIRKTLTTVVSTVVLAGGIAVGAAGPANAATCPHTASPLINGASAHWTLSCSGNNVTMSGWVQDTKADGKCAKVRINAGNGAHQAPTACGSGVRKPFKFTFQGTKKAEGRLAVV